MNRRWTIGEEDLKSIKELLYSNKIFLDKFKKVCYTRIKELEKAKCRTPDYEDSNWAIKQADMNGYIRSLHDMINLLDLEE